MARDVISTCPVCSSELSITRLQCRGCGTTIEGEFNVGRFGRLSREQLAILESFLRAPGKRFLALPKKEIKAISPDAGVVMFRGRAWGKPAVLIANKTAAEDVYARIRAREGGFTH